MKQQADLNRSNVSDRQKKERKRAKKTGKSMRKNAGDCAQIVGAMNATDGITKTSQISGCLRGDVLDKNGKKFCSQDAV